MFTNTRELLDFITTNSHAEGRSYEFKRGLPWDGDFRFRIVKGILALSNVPDGGYLIIGVEKNNSTNIYEPNGMSESVARTYDNDHVSQFTSNYADPSVMMTLKIFEESEKRFVVIEVSEFSEIPVICKNNGGEALKAGEIYTRTNRMPESARCTAVELREILELATDKGIRRQRERLGRAGIVIPIASVIPEDETLFNNERGVF
ncbi:MAG: ATP-binding protein [Thaumarchaeota archaeon]|nr:ATP-binding protein [Nitrososphaerota archaeon]